MTRLRRAAACIVAVSTIVSCGGADPQSAEVENSAAQFVVRCELSHTAFDDPLVLPWQPGKSHLHLFFGNRAVDSSPGYDDRLLNADTSCEDRRNTASYWAPALLDPAGRTIEPIAMTAYHRVGTGIAPGDVVAYPEGLMLIGGDAASQEAQSSDVVAWSCGDESTREARPIQCGDDSTLRMSVTFPDCWDGERLTGFGSSAHARYSSDETDGCPETHPVALPQLTIGIDFPPVDPTDLSLSSGDIATAHADFWNVWDQQKLEGDVADCINRDLDCSVPG